MSRAGPVEYNRRLWLRLVVAVTFILVYLPIITLIIFSFNDSKRNVVWRGFTLKYYEKAWNNPSLFEAFMNSLLIAAVTTVIATILGVMIAVLLWRFRFPFKPAYEGLMALPIVVPEICMGVAMLAFLNIDYGTAVGGEPAKNLITLVASWVWPFNLSAIMAAHVAFTFPFVAIVVRARLGGFNRELEDASRDLGASEWQTFWGVVFPYMRPGVVAGALLAFTLSLDDFVITFFTSGPDTLTFPVKVYSMVRFSVTPEVNAASTALIVITVLVTGLALYLQSPEKTEA